MEKISNILLGVSEEKNTLYEFLKNILGNSHEIFPYYGFGHLKDESFSAAVLDYNTIEAAKNNRSIDVVGQLVERNPGIKIILTGSDRFQFVNLQEIQAKYSGNISIPELEKNNFGKSPYKVIYKTIEQIINSSKPTKSEEDYGKSHNLGSEHL